MLEKKVGKQSLKKRWKKKSENKVGKLIWKKKKIGEQNFGQQVGKQSQITKSENKVRKPNWKQSWKTKVRKQSLKRS